jgi:CDGSH-type Zn-finger protein
LEIRAHLVIQGAAVMLQQETRATLCRCGASQNKPFCDNQHRDIVFEPVDAEPIVRPDSEAPGSGPLGIIATQNGPLELVGPVRIVNEAGAILFEGRAVSLCRCGGSSSKPFCDGTHERIAFTAE